MNIYEYFLSKFGNEPHDETLRELPCESPCGKDCVRAIDAAVAFAEASDSSLRNGIEALANEAVAIFWRG